MGRDLINYLNYLKDRIDMIVVSPKNKWIFLKISKTAGTSIYRNMILKQLQVDCFNSENGKQFNKWLSSFKDDKELRDQYFIWTFVREPFDRS
jgi:hypothetical protein